MSNCALQKHSSRWSSGWATSTAAWIRSSTHVTVVSSSRPSSGSCGASASSEGGRVGGHTTIDHTWGPTIPTWTTALFAWMAVSKHSLQCSLAHASSAKAVDPTVRRAIYQAGMLASLHPDLCLRDTSPDRLAPALCQCATPLTSPVRRPSRQGFSMTGPWPKGHCMPTYKMVKSWNKDQIRGLPLKLRYSWVLSVPLAFLPVLAACFCFFYCFVLIWHYWHIIGFPITHVCIQSSYW